MTCQDIFTLIYYYLIFLFFLNNLIFIHHIKIISFQFLFVKFNFSFHIKQFLIVMILILCLLFFTHKVIIVKESYLKVLLPIKITHSIDF